MIETIFDFDRLDAKDRQILRLLQENGRISNAELAEKVCLSPSACLRRVQLLEQAGVIERYVALLNPAPVRRGLTVFIEISLERQTDVALDAFEQAVRACPEVMQCSLMAGDTDYLLEVSVADSNDYERLHRQVLARLPGAARLRTRFTIRGICKRTAFPV
ncbi:Lrp/AsnC family transcriptional regulator [Telmatospirillum siberiense]|uniref:AsnC family transcriptional regulator n=1 Tax=Telmatospirillum siberiense TaxID=382514 RepID=A0A2N3PTB1_9PROT|nr:Lrp/AsnC family transcriptional regulator [Telmatospirillum siberiense]PKU23616.1 AsnC family transcriptional regulator [Telmatospirillum siberiense]